MFNVGGSPKPRSQLTRADQQHNKPFQKDTKIEERSHYLSKLGRTHKKTEKTACQVELRTYCQADRYKGRGCFWRAHDSETPRRFTALQKTCVFVHAFIRITVDKQRTTFSISFECSTRPADTFLGSSQGVCLLLRD